MRLSAKERWLAPHEHDEEFQKELFRPVLSIFPGVPKERSFLCRVCKRANEDTGKERIENGRKVLGGAHRGCFGQRLMLPRGSAARS